MRLKDRKARDTRAVYRWEYELQSGGRYDAPMRELRALARRIWRDRGRRGNRCPLVIAGRGVRFGGQWCSYCLGFSLIVLARHHRNRVVLIHEMTHALGPMTHGNRFQNLYAELLEQYL